MEHNDEIDLQELFKAIFYRINLILYSLIVCILLSLIYILATPKIYISSTILEFPVNNVSVVKGDTFQKNYSDAGIRDFSKYADVPFAELALDFFLPDDTPLPSEIENS